MYHATRIQINLILTMYCPSWKKKDSFIFGLNFSTCMYYFYLWFWCTVLSTSTCMCTHTSVLHWYIRIGIDIWPEMYMYVVYIHCTVIHICSSEGPSNLSIPQVPGPSTTPIQTHMCSTHMNVVCTCIMSFISYTSMTGPWYGSRSTLCWRGSLDFSVVAWSR